MIHRLVPSALCLMALLACGEPETAPAKGGKVGTVAELTTPYALDKSQGAAWLYQVSHANLIPRDVWKVKESTLPEAVQAAGAVTERSVRIFAVPVNPAEDVEVRLSFFAPPDKVEFGPLVSGEPKLAQALASARKAMVGQRCRFKNPLAEPVVIFFSLAGPIGCNYELRVSRLS